MHATSVCFRALFAVTALLAVSVQAAELPAPKLPKKHLPVPLVQQATDYSCGAASLLAVLEYWKVYDGTETALYKPLHTSKKYGTEEGPMAQLARKYGLQAELRYGMSLQDLRDSLAEGNTVIVDLQAWPEHPDDGLSWANRWDDGHYVVLVAMDADYGYFMDPSAHGAYAYIPLPELLERWHDMDDRHGTIKRTEHLGIAIRGSQAQTRFPGDLIRTL
jgi:predicted double-glycine peptidase